MSETELSLISIFQRDANTAIEQEINAGKLFTETTSFAETEALVRAGHNLEGLHKYTQDLYDYHFLHQKSWPTPEASVSCTIMPPHQPWFPPLGGLIKKPSDLVIIASDTAGRSAHVASERRTEVSKSETDQQWAERIAERLFGQITERDGVQTQIIRGDDGRLIPRENTREEHVSLCRDLLDEIERDKLEPSARLSLLHKLTLCRCPKCGSTHKFTEINGGDIRHRCSNRECRHVFLESEALPPGEVPELSWEMVEQLLKTFPSRLMKLPGWRVENKQEIITILRDFEAAIIRRLERQE